MFRLVAMIRDARSVSSAVLPFTRMDAMGSFEVPSQTELRLYQALLLVGTCGGYTFLPKKEMHCLWMLYSSLTSTLRKVLIVIMTCVRIVLIVVMTKGREVHNPGGSAHVGWCLLRCIV